MRLRVNNNADVLLFTHKVRAEALQTLRIASENSPSRNSPRGLSAKRLDREEVLGALGYSKEEIEEMV